MKNKVIKKIIVDEIKRQNNSIELIASENYPSHDIYEAVGSVLQAKYAEGYPGARYYGGCENVDKSEQYAINQACLLFGCKHANVQPHSGSQANAAAYYAMMPQGGKVLSMKLSEGSHITHTPLSKIGNRNYEFAYYTLGADGHLDYDVIENVALQELPDVILCGYSAYPYKINFEKFSAIRDKVQEIKGAGSKVYLMCDMAHIAGLVATGHHPSPFPYADIVTSTTHKTLRGPRSGIILCNDNELAKAVDSAVFPKSQGGPLEHVIAAKAICFTEALSSTFYEYIDSVVKNTKACQDYFAQLGMIVSGTDNHLFLLNTWESYHLTGAEAQKKLEAVGITTNKNMLPGDIFKPNVTSGLRIGLAAITSRGCNIALATEIASVIHHTLNGTCDEKEAKKAVKKIIKKLKRIPL